MSCVICVIMDAIPVIVSVFVFRTITINFGELWISNQLVHKIHKSPLPTTKFVHPLPIEYFKK